MAKYTYDRLTAQDAGFLWAEKPNNAMHVGAVALFAAGPLQREDGSIDIDRYRAQVESVLHWIPRYRQKIEWTPIENWPVWVDDRRFDLGYHIRHIALPRPGSLEQLKELAARINARRLDRRHALCVREGEDQYVGRVIVKCRDVGNAADAVESVDARLDDQQALLR